MNLILLYCWGCLAAPWEDAPTPPEEFRPLLRGAAIGLEIWDQKEADSTKTGMSTIGVELNYLNSWHKRLLGCPPLSFQLQLPDLEICNQYVLFNRAYRDYLDMVLRENELRQCDRWETDQWLKAAINETSQLGWFWQEVVNAQTQSHQNCISTRRMAMKRIMNNLEKYDGFPPYVPIWRFAQR